MRSENNLIVFCECESPEHMITLDDYGDDCIYVSYHLAPLSFFERLKHAIKYVFGYRSQYGDFDEVLIGKEAAKELIEYLEDFLDNNDCKAYCDSAECGVCCNSANEIVP